jgi:hypothetical protein
MTCAMRSTPTPSLTLREIFMTHTPFWSREHGEVEFSLLKYDYAARLS